MNLYESRLPYPAIQAREPNRCYAQEMLDNIGGQNSEMTAISLYIYNHFICQGELAALFHEISITEMRHLEIFGRLAKQLGADPRLWSVCNGQLRFWSPAYNRYPTKMRPLLENVLDHEQKAVAKYERQAGFIQDQNIVDNLCRVLADEKNHIMRISDQIAHCVEI